MNRKVNRFSARPQQRALIPADSGQPPSQASSGPVTIEGLVTIVTFENPNNGFRVIRVQPENGESVVVVGVMQQLPAGTCVRVTGTWQHDQQYGQQVRALTVLTMVPDTAGGLQRYLGSGLIPGIGPELAKRIVGRFGLKALDILERSPHRLSEVSGLGERRVKAIAQAWQEQRVAREVMVFLQSHDISPALALRIHKHYGREAIALISANPYRLASDIWGVGFRKADAIARAMGIAEDAPERIQAAVLHMLEQAAERGHVLLPLVELVQQLELFLEQPRELVDQAIDSAQSRKLVRIEDTHELGQVLYSTPRYFEEVALSQALARLCHGTPRALSGAGQAIAAFEKRKQATLVDAQRQAVHLAAKAGAMVITGGPGVGKTTLVLALLELFERAHLNVRLAAPTGRASRRMTETTGREASTIHRLLEFDPATRGFRHNEKCPLELDVLVVDETSMLDQTLALALVRAIPVGARIVLAGDVDQLPSIGAGAVLRDIIESDVMPCIRLTHVFRQAALSRIVENAHRIHDGLMPEAPGAGEQDSDFFVVEADDAVSAAERVCKLVSERIPKKFGLNPRRDVQVLTPMHRGDAGSHQLNARLQELLNPHGQPVNVGTRNLRVGDKVMQLRNDYGRDVFNGDVGYVEAFNQADRKVIVNIDGRPVPYEEGQLDELVLAYACSIHKSQGSEYPAVVVPMLSSHFVMLSRNLLYTAVTRGKRLVVLVTSKKAMRIALDETRREQRFTRLRERLRAALGR